MPWNPLRQRDEDIWCMVSREVCLAGWLWAVMNSSDGVAMTKHESLPALMRLSLNEVLLGDVSISPPDTHIRLWSFLGHSIQLQRALGCFQVTRWSQIMDTSINIQMDAFTWAFFHLVGVWSSVLSLWDSVTWASCGSGCSAAAHVLEE